MQVPSYGPIAAPVLPSITDRNAELLAHSQRHDRHVQQPPRKQEKVTGGVAQELDYEMDQMTDYVADMAQSLVMPNSKVSPAFRKFVSGLLSSTRLPSSTILLGLNYLSKRMNMLSSQAPRKTTDGQVWRMLTIALLLGSKFLDDNTFQNRSWSDVSGIAIVELNTLEKEWLMAIDWNLHIDFANDTDYQSWLASWNNWREVRNKQREATLQRLAPLAPVDTNVQHHPSHKPFSSATSTPSYLAHLHDSTSYQVQPHRYEQPSWSQNRPAYELSPPSAPESGPNTPEWMMLPNSGLPPHDWGYGYDSFYNRRNAQPSSHVSFAIPQDQPFQTPYHGHYQQNIWGQPVDSRGYCGRPEQYFMPPAYGQQPVVG
jgi:hypothetical protein